MGDSMSRAPETMTHEEAIRTMAAERYLLDEMADAEREEFEAHYFGCSECAEDLRMSNLVREEIRMGATAASQPARSDSARRSHVLRPARWSNARSRSVMVPWAVAASLAALVGYQSLGPAGRGRGALEPRALAPVMLRGATRGAAPVVVPGEQPVVALSLDAMADPGAEQLSFDLLDPSGNTLLSGRASVPPPGVPLLLLVPSDRLAQSGRHRLIVRDTSRPESVAGEYAFDVSR